MIFLRDLKNFFFNLINLKWLKWIFKYFFNDFENKKNIWVLRWSRFESLIKLKIAKHLFNDKKNPLFGLNNNIKTAYLKFLLDESSFSLLVQFRFAVNTSFIFKDILRIIVRKRQIQTCSCLNSSFF
jgi:hypothetical protein